MHAVSVSGLKHNPAEALRQARSAPVVVLNRDHPDAVLIGLEEGGVLQAPGVRAALATALFRDGELSLVRAARVAELEAVLASKTAPTKPTPKPTASRRRAAARRPAPRRQPSDDPPSGEGS